MNENRIDSREDIVIFSVAMARKLLREGYTLIDIKPDKKNTQRSVYIFKKDNGIFKIINTVTKEREEEKKIC